MKWLRVLIVFAPVLCLLAETQPSPAPEDVVGTYTAISSQQGARLRGASMEVEIEANLPKLQKHGRLHALRRISRLGRITYEAVRFEGDNSVKSNVIARYLAAETQAQSSDDSSLAVTPANYKFKYKGRSGEEENQIHVFQLTPRRKQVGLFKGELWLDAETCLPVRESGRLVKDSVDFSYGGSSSSASTISGTVWPIPLQIASTVETRLVGKAELTVRFPQRLSRAILRLPIAAASGQ